MTLDTQAVKHIAHLARIKIDDTAMEPLKEKLNAIFGFINLLSEVNTEGVQPMVGVGARSMPMRDDKITDGDCVDKVLANAPDVAENMFVVPKVVE